MAACLSSSLLFVAFSFLSAAVAGDADAAIGLHRPLPQTGVYASAPGVGPEDRPAIADVDVSRIAAEKQRQQPNHMQSSLHELVDPFVAVSPLPSAGPGGDFPWLSSSPSPSVTSGWVPTYTIVSTPSPYPGSTAPDPNQNLIAAGAAAIACTGMALATACFFRNRQQRSSGRRRRTDGARGLLDDWLESADGSIDSGLEYDAVPIKVAAVHGAQLVKQAKGLSINQCGDDFDEGACDEPLLLSGDSGLDVDLTLAVASSSQLPGQQPPLSLAAILNRGRRAISTASAGSKSTVASRGSVPVSVVDSRPQSCLSAPDVPSSPCYTGALDADSTADGSAACAAQA